MADGDKVRLPMLPVKGKPLGRHRWHDPRNRDYPARTLLADGGGRQVRPWWGRPIFDQQGSSCTFQMAAGLMLSTPFGRNPAIRKHRAEYDTEGERDAAYRESQKYDPWPGEEPAYQGTSTDAPMKMLRELGVISGWRWCFGLQDCLDTIDRYGPVGVGTTWKTGMDTPDKKFRIRYEGDVRGGHAWVWEYVDHAAKEVVAVNSWGTGYGKRGRMRVPFEEADKMLADGGEALTIVLP